MKWDLANLMYKQLIKNKKELNKIAFAPPLAIPIGVEASKYLGAVLTVWLGKYLYDSFKLSKDTTIEEFINSMDLSDEQKNDLKKEAIRVLDLGADKEGLIFHLVNYAETMFIPSPNKDFKLPSLEDFNLNKLLNEDKDEEEEDDSKKRKIYFAKAVLTNSWSLEGPFEDTNTFIYYGPFKTEESLQKWIDKIKAAEGIDESGILTFIDKTNSFISKSDEQRIKAFMKCAPKESLLPELRSSETAYLLHSFSNVFVKVFDIDKLDKQYKEIKC